MPIKLDIDNAAIVKLTAKLERMHKSALPVAIRETLNTTAFNTKQAIPKEADKHFDIRSPNFFRAFSRFEKAKGFKVEGMVALAGMVDKKPGGQSEQAGRNMVQRQRGGTIQGRAFIPTREARVSRNPSKRVRPINRIENLNLSQLVDSDSSHAGTENQRFVKSAIFAFKRNGPGALLRHRGTDGTVRIYRIRNIKTRGALRIQATAIYTYKAGRSVPAGRVVAFTLLAAKREQKKMNRIFREKAKQQIQRLRK